MIIAAETNSHQSEKQHHWRRIIDEWNQGGESQKKFCARLGIKTPTFQYWLAKLSPKKNRAKYNFAKLEVEPSAITQCKDQSIRIELPSGIKINLPLVLRMDELSNVFKMLGVTHA
ncbi:MAG: hypothetical protein H0U71_00625 [Gammaproteobacteria bacterium]|nr:hypothetical protein [Gammaproteobacteria bacterium]